MSLMEQDMKIELQKEGQVQGVLKELYGKLSPFVWVIKIMGVLKRVPQLTYLTGFGVSKEGSESFLIMTCAHGNWNSWAHKIIKARRLNGVNGFEFDAEVVNIKPRWDLCVMKIVGLGSKVEDCVNFGSGVLHEADNIICIGHAGELVGSCLVGRVAYNCVRDVEIEYDSLTTCNEFDSQALTTTPLYRIMGHIWNSEYFHLAKQRDKLEGRGRVNRNFEMNLQPLLPIIQCCGLIGGEGTSGAPIFNLHGELVGMLVLGMGSEFQIGVHVTALNMFLNNLHLSKGDVETVGESSKRMKIT